MTTKFVQPALFPIDRRTKGYVPENTDPETWLDEQYYLKLEADKLRRYIDDVKHIENPDSYYGPSVGTLEAKLVELESQITI